jgi:hypothetical protein
MTRKRAVWLWFVFVGCRAPIDEEAVDDEPLGTSVAPLVGGASASCTGSGPGLTTCGTGGES